MRNLIVTVHNRHRRRAVVCLLAGLFTLTATRVRAVEDPPGCSLESGGQGNTSAGGLNFDKVIAHVGDTIRVFPNLGMVSNACRAVSVTGTVYIASGPLTNFLENVTLNPGQLVTCPSNALCRPGPYSFVITPDLVGATVFTPQGSAIGSPKVVRAVETGFGTVQTGEFPDQLSDFHTASIFILQPCMKVFKTCELP